ncbi:MAG: diguanylate cyclase, partial [Nitrospirae bacterium]|nr:diguanylate cyclase [Nitrospirota bacterium]
MDDALPLILLAGSTVTLGLLFALTRRRFRRAQHQAGVYLRRTAEGALPSATPSLPSEWSELREALEAIHERLLRLRSEEQQLRALAILNETSSNILETLEIDALLQMVSHAARVLVKAEVGIVFLTESPLKEDRIRISSSQEQPLSHASAWKACLWALPHQKHLYQPPSAAADSASFPLPPGTKNLLALPLRSPMRLQGWLAVANKQGEQPFTKEDEDLMQMLAVQALLGIEKVLLYQEKEQLAITDPLTGLFNRRELERRLSEEVRRSERYGRDFSLLLLDLDHFKQLNDTRGHPAGDAVLNHLGHLLRREARMLDIPFRYGG